MTIMSTLNGYDIVDDVSRNGVTTAGTGAAYTATVPGITSLKVGANFVMVPHVASTTTAPTLNVNGLGAKTIRRRLSNSTSSTVAGTTDNWLVADKPVNVVYDGTFWVVADYVKPVADDLYGTLPTSAMPSSYNKLFPENMLSLTISNSQSQWSVSRDDLFNLYTAKQVFVVSSSTMFGKSYSPAVVSAYLDEDTYTIKYLTIGYMLQQPLSGSESESELPSLSLPISCGVVVYPRETPGYVNTFRAVDCYGKEVFTDNFVEVRYRP